MHYSATLLSTIAAICATANGALTTVTNFGSNPTNLQMNIWVPSTLATNPAIILAVSYQ